MPCSCLVLSEPTLTGQFPSHPPKMYMCTCARVMGEACVCVFAHRAHARQLRSQKECLFSSILIRTGEPLNTALLGISLTRGNCLTLVKINWAEMPRVAEASGVGINSLRETSTLLTIMFATSMQFFLRSYYAALLSLER